MGRLRLAYKGVQTAIAEFALDTASDVMKWVQDTTSDIRDLVAALKTLKDFAESGISGLLGGQGPGGGGRTPNTSLLGGAPEGSTDAANALANSLLVTKTPFIAGLDPRDGKSTS